ncbi:DUF6522 family protein [Cognatilysobacter segetis]|uniref:DUF6522 family protein n=1 Tax=Cognatilysobacter segetis TaxID=2492394 RepID=UPI0010604F3A|nr:DUF6522 family protein [Lysobacter segetis]
MHEQQRLLPGAEPMPDIAIDAALVAPRLGLDVDTFRALMDDGRIRVLCERGVGDDAGRYRATFYYHAARARLVVDAQGRLLQAEPALAGSAP